MKLSLLLLLSSTLFAQTASQKRDAIWQKITELPYAVLQEPKPTKSEALCPLSYGFWESKALLSPFPDWLVDRFTHNDDEMPDEDRGHVKAIHSYGTTALVRWIPTGVSHPFSGIYRNGGMGIARVSLAKPYDGKSYIPGLAVKIFLDGASPSVNFHVMDSLEGQGSDFNFFSRIFSNLIEPPQSSALKFVSIFFERALNHMDHAPLKPNQLPLDEGGLHAPYQLRFVPSEYARTLFENSSESDIRKQFAAVHFNVHEPLYAIYAENEESKCGESWHIADLYLESQFVASEYGDRVLFFKHQRRMPQAL